MAPIRVMLVDDSILFLGAMKAAIEREAQIEVTATAANGQAALALVPSARPNVIVCDVQMPKMSGIEFLKALLPVHKIPVVVISSSPDVTLSALANGAVDFIQKPAAGEQRQAFFDRMVSTIRIAARTNVGAKTIFRKEGGGQIGAVLTAALGAIVAIGASTGGTDAILEVVRALPQNTPGIVVTQHMPVGFTAMYAQRLDRECKMRVREARDGDRVERGLILLAAGDHHLRVHKEPGGYCVTSKKGERVNGHMPSVDVLFDSVASAAGPRAVGVILTGMGADGAQGLLHMRQAGAHTIGQNKETCVVYGMPMVAFNKGAVAQQLPLYDIPAHLVASINKLR